MLTTRSTRRGAAESPEGATGSAVCSMSENRMLTGMLPGIAKRVPAGTRRNKLLRPEVLRGMCLEAEWGTGEKVLPPVTNGRESALRDGIARRFAAQDDAVW